MFILMILGLFMGGSLVLFSVRARVLEAKGVFGMVSRETGLVLNNLLLAVAAFVVFIGTIWPLVAELLFARKLSVGQPFFDAAFTPFVILLALILPVGAMLPWKRAELGRVMRHLWAALALAVAVALLAFAMQTGRSTVGPIGAGLGAWLVLGSFVDFAQRCGRGSISQRIARAFRLPRADWGKSTAHAGLGLTIFAVAAMNAWVTEDIRVVKIGETFPLGSYEVTLQAVNAVEGPNYQSQMADMLVTRAGAEVALLHPEKRFYPVQAMPTTEAAIDQGVFRDLYLVIGDKQDNGGYAVRSYIKPFANWLWLAVMMMAFGGILSLSDRRFRVAAGARRADVAVAAE
jgi:cytochrome c-type biogenesis protein CcmF